MEHAFVIPAFRESPFLEPCILSLREQERRSRIVLTTSTPNDHIAAIADRFRLPLVVGTHKPGIAADWNFALTATGADLVTIAHQDDVYAPPFAALTCAAFERHPDADLVFTAFSEHTAAGPRPTNINLMIKRLLSRRGFGRAESLCAPARKRRLLALGNPICCPSVTINRSRQPGFRFLDRFRSNLDWDAWERLAGEDGSFVYLREVLVSHRVHPGTATTALIGNQVRDQEDRDMLQRFWPHPAAAALARVYRLSYAGNRT